MNSCVTPVKAPADSSWKAELRLGLAKTARGVVLKESQHQGPLYVQKPFYPEGRELAHLYLLHPPGGMVSGDTLEIHVNMAAAAQCLVTTPGAGRVYRARSDRALQQQKIRLDLSSDSTLEWLPLENIIYPGANTQLNTDVFLAENSRFIGWDITCLGLPASDQPFCDGDVTQRLQIFRQGRLKLREALHLNANQHMLLDGRAGLQGCSVNALLVAGPFDESEATDLLINELRAECQSLTGEALAAVSLCGEFLTLRYIGNCAEQARLLFVRCWTVLRPSLLGRPACEPRIWAT